MEIVRTGENMYSRVITCKIDTSRLDEFRAALNNEFLPRIQKQQGFIDNIESLDPATGEFCCTTLWNNRSDVENYDNGLFQEVAAKLGPLMTEQPTVRTLPVENSSVHRVAAGKAA
jgi:quinol monooxygenase YgiN